MRTQTDYTEQKNRCANCGHRLVMHTPKCTVENGDAYDPAKFMPCLCKKAVKNG